MSIQQLPDSGGDQRSLPLSASRLDQSQIGVDIDVVVTLRSATVRSRFDMAGGSNSTLQGDGGHRAMIQAELVSEEEGTMLPDKERMIKLQDQAQRDLIEIRKEKDTLMAEVKALKEDSSKHAAEIKRANESYRALLDEKVALAEQLSVSDFPVNISFR